MIRAFSSVCFALALPLTAISTDAAAAQAPAPAVFAELGLTITPPALEDLKYDGKVRGQVHASWTGTLEGADIEIYLFVLPIAQFKFIEPEDVTDVLLDNLRDEAKGDPSFTWDLQQLVPGTFGYTPYASLAHGAEREDTKITGRIFMFSGLLKESGYVVQVQASPEPGEKGMATLLDFLKKGVAYKGESRNWKWSDAEAKARWERDAPASTHKKFEGALRTDHYLILTNSSGGKLFAKKMEECYAAIRKMYPFDDVAGRNLMPVFLFRSPEEYYGFCETVAEMTLEEAKNTKGHAWKDYYATWYEAPNDPVHIHEATHQIFANRLRLHGGGSWFQEGVAEYISSAKNDLNMAARAVAKGRHVGLREFLRIPSLISGGSKDDKSGEDGASNNYAQAALLIEFLRESKFGKAKFQDFIHAVGLTPRGNVKAIEAGFQRTYGTSIDELEKLFVEYCKKR